MEQLWFGLLPPWSVYVPAEGFNRSPPTWLRAWFGADGPEMITDIIYYDVQQCYVDINAVKLTKDRLDGYWNDTVTTVQPVDMTLQCQSLQLFSSICPITLRTSFRHLHASDAEPQANCQAAEWRRLCRCQLYADHWRLGASKQ